MNKEDTLDQILEGHLEKYVGKISARDWNNLQLALYRYMQDAYNRGWTDCQNIGEGNVTNHLCNKDYPSALCVSDIDRATDIYLDSLKEFVSSYIKKSDVIEALIDEDGSRMWQSKGRVWSQVDPQGDARNKLRQEIRIKLDLEEE